MMRGLMAVLLLMACDDASKTAKEQPPAAEGASAPKSLAVEQSPDAFIAAVAEELKKAPINLSASLAVEAYQPEGAVIGVTYSAAAPPESEVKEHAQAVAMAGVAAMTRSGTPRAAIAVMMREAGTGRELMNGLYVDGKFSAEAPLDVTAQKMSADYDSNEIAADEVYKGRQLCVDGKVQKVGKDILDEPTVALQGMSSGATAPSMTPRPRARSEWESVVFSFDDASNLTTIRKGQRVRICGEGAGSSLGSPIVKQSKLAAAGR